MTFLLPEMNCSVVNFFPAMNFVISFAAFKTFSGEKNWLDRGLAVKNEVLARQIVRISTILLLAASTAGPFSV